MLECRPGRGRKQRERRSLELCCISIQQMAGPLGGRTAVQTLCVSGFLWTQEQQQGGATKGQGRYWCEEVVEAVTKGVEWVPWPMATNRNIGER